ncbi:uncharacterized protein B0I36DRAFT_117898 [Microdochium trichocladiopsis]|uniref:Uncharacterized protein n=1 Tax=Microdochium trichocladiopsis TaxID=1682393 RepID=A0A9P9BQN4_9PEZI|nr:uncharacterized protein B0I36DRAFT_117898 [Microdochium trichocladiopsis]KAH7031040.1 hypothetical protein B0I36DRAFT_117898 [Microdochium trichocladiopsis]
MASMVRLDSSAAIQELAVTAGQECGYWYACHHDPRQHSDSGLYSCSRTEGQMDFAKAFCREHVDFYQKWRVTCRLEVRGPLQLRHGSAHFPHPETTILPLRGIANNEVAPQVQFEMGGEIYVLDWAAGSGTWFPRPIKLSVLAGCLSFLVIELVPLWR